MHWQTTPIAAGSRKKALAVCINQLKQRASSSPVGISAVDIAISIDVGQDSIQISLLGCIPGVDATSWLV
jgi:hypothetical protein